MRLKRLEVQGFKTFAERTEIRFDGPLTAIVGPNGSGKSNLVEAIRWVLGEQGLKALRARRTEELLYAGGPGRRAAGFAEVTLVLDNEDGQLPLPTAEVALTRRAYRSGENEYRINGEKVLLRDYLALTADLGKGLTIVHQGLVDEFLALSPRQRREMLEEVAGIGAARLRRREAERRLEESRRNLVRVADLLAELEPRLRRLRRQAEGAARHREMAAEVERLERTVLLLRWQRAREALEEARTRHREAQAAWRAAREALDGLETRREERAEARRRAREAWRQGQDAVAYLLDRRRELEARQAHLEARRSSLEEREALARREGKRLREEIVRLEGALEGLPKAPEGALVPLQREVEGLQAALEEAEETLTRLEARRRELEEGLEAAARQAARARGERAAVEGRRRALGEERARWAAERTRLQEEEGRLRQQLLRQQQALEEARQALRALEGEAEALDRELAEARTALARARDRQAAAEAEASRARGRLQALERLEQEGVGYRAGVEAARRWARRHGVRLRTVAEAMEVPASLVRALEAALGGQLQHLIVDRWEEARAAIEHLKARKAGRATFLPLDTLRPRPPLRAPDADGVLGCALDLVRFDPEDRPALQQVLGGILVVEDLETARRLLPRLKGGRIVTLDGEVVQASGAVTGGREGRAREGLLARRRALQEAREAEAAARRALEEAQREVQEAQARLQALEVERAELEARRQGAREALRRAEAALEEVEGRARRLTRELEWLAEAEERARREEADLEAAEAAARRALEEAEARRAELQPHLEATLQALEEARAGRDRRLQALEAARARLAAREREVQAQARRRQELEAALAAARERAGAYDAEAEAARTERTELERALAALEEERAALEARLEGARARLPELEEALRQAEIAWEALAGKEAALGRELAGREAALARAAAEVERAEALLRDLEARAGRLGWSPARATPEEREAAAARPLEAWEGELERARRRLERLGPVNPLALEEYEEVRERVQFLQEQREDLEAAIADLRTLIRDLEAEMESRFLETLHGIDRVFRQVFRELFGGGEAGLRLVGEGDLEARGVEVIARPPRKKTQTLDLLSGGERALTTAALLFALLTARPRPFCLLDEVDAALDEANVVRFRQRLRQLAERTQVVIVTHNRHTVEVAETIYGITLGPDGASRVVSLRLEEVES